MALPDVRFIQTNWAQQLQPHSIGHNQRKKLGKSFSDKLESMAMRAANQCSPWITAVKGVYYISKRRWHGL